MKADLINKQKFPRTYREFVDKFHNDAACLAYLEKLRWPEHFCCPKCKSLKNPWRQTRGRFVCSDCKYEVSVTSGTIFDRTRTPLTTWFEAAWHVTTAKNGFSAKTLERTLGVCYRTSWMILQRFRVAMVRSERKPLSGTVEIDESLLGGVKVGGKRGRGSVKKIIAIAVEVLEPKGFGRVRMKCIPDASEDSLLPFIDEAVAKGTRIHTDGWSGYHNLSQKGYEHDVTVLSSSGDPAHVSMPAVHRIASLLKRWILGTHQGSVSYDHIQSYLEEYTFRFNRRNSGSRGHLFRRLMEQAVVTEPIRVDDITHGYNWKPLDVVATGFK